MSTVTLAEVKAHLSITTSTTDAEVQSFIDLAEAAIVTQIGPLAVATKTEWVSGYGLTLWLSHIPVVSLTSVTSIEGTTTPVGQLTVLDGGQVEYTQRRYFTSRLYSVVYQAGWAVVPEDLKLAVLAMTRHLMETQRGALLVSGTAGSVDLSNTLPGAAFAFPPRVEQLIAPYRAPMVV